LRNDQAAPEEQLDWTGSVLGEWHLVRLLGMGGMGSVYEATGTSASPVAIKVLHPDLCQNRRSRQRFLREAQIANKVRHPGVVSVRECGEANGVAFLVMELLTGESIKERCEKTGGTLPLHDVLRIADEVLDALAAAHEQGVVHRDIKPGNVFLTADGGVKVLDFGIARVREESGGAEVSATRSGATLGTPAFLSPEQARGRSDDVDERTDLWAVGALMYSVLTGRFVHQAETPNEYLILAATQPAPPLLTWAPHVPRGVARLVDRALALDKSARWPSARAMQAAVRELRASGTDGPAHAAHAVEATLPEAGHTPRRRYAIRPATIWLAAAGAAGSIWVATSQTCSAPTKPNGATTQAPPSSATPWTPPAPIETVTPPAANAAAPSAPAAATAPPQARKTMTSRATASISTQPQAPPASPSAGRPALDVNDPSLDRRK
jgi:eukaryotic-like serine/threonine-protein kinase